MTRWTILVCLCTACDGAMVEPPADDAGTTPDAGSVGDGGVESDSGPMPMVDGGPPPSEDGRWGEPETVFTLPPPSGTGYYLPDIQASFPEVDWATLDRLYIAAGHYAFIQIGNLPARDPADPLVITNIGGQVRVGALGHYYLFNVGGGSGWVLTGRYDPISETGDVGFQGHRGGVYANTQGNYGIVVDDDFVRANVTAFAIGGRATEFEIEYVEACDVGFAGIMLKSDDDPLGTMDGVSVHDVYIHDTGSEGFYIGSTQAQPQHTIRGLELHHNRVLRTGTEAVQLGQLGGDIEVHHNVFGPSALDWRSAFQRYQDGNMQIAVRHGSVDVHHNVFLGAAGSQNSVFGGPVDGDPHDAADRVWIHDNYYAHYRDLFAYVAARGLDPMTFRFERNLIRGYRFDYDEVYATTTEPAEMIRAGDALTVIELIDNDFDVAALDFCDQIANTDGNGEGPAASGMGNTRGAVPAVRFVDSGLPDAFDWLDMEMWTDVATLGMNVPVSYRRGMVVTHLGVPYRCDAATSCGTGLVPSEHPEVWAALPPFPDDVRLADDSPHQGVGLE